MEITSIDAFLTYFESVRSRTRRIAALIPEDELEFRPSLYGLTEPQVKERSVRAAPQ